MLVKCLGNSPEHLSTREEKEVYASFVTMDKVHLEIGHLYIVYGVLFRDGWPWFLVVEEPEAEYPKPHFGSFFEVVDPDVPPNWAMSRKITNLGGLALVPKEWVDEPLFMEELVNEDPDALATFERLKDRLRKWHKLETSRGST